MIGVVGSDLDPWAGEIADLLAVVDRDLADTKVQQVSSDQRLAVTYEGAPQRGGRALYTD
jgi:hypothetical protein